MSKKFVSLHNHSHIGSPLDGFNSIADLFDGSSDAGHPGFALTDHGSMSALYDAWKESKKRNIKFVPGNEMYFSENLDPENKKNYHIVLLAQNEIGYKNLLKLNLEAFKNQSIGFMGKGTPRVSWDQIQKYNEGLFALTACSNGIISKTLISDNEVEKAELIIKRLHSIYKDRFFLELQPHALIHINQKTGKEVNQVKLNESLLKYSKDFNIPYVITCDAHYRNKEMSISHDIMLAIKDKKPVDDPNRFRYGIQDMYFKTEEEIVNFFGRDIAELGMANTIKIFDACSTPSYLEGKGPILPKFPVKEESDYLNFREWFEKNEDSIEEDKAYLRYKCIQGFKEKFSDLNPIQKKNYWSRTKKELEILEMRDFSSYLLIVSDYFNWAKKSQIPTGPGRGSVNGSLVAYLIGITKVDPIKHDLLFERFHNKEKKAYPDIDLDFSKSRRDQVKQYLKSKYGEDRVAGISNWSTLSPKVVIKDVARSLNIEGDKSTTFQVANHITSIMSDEKTIEDNEIKNKRFQEYMTKYPKLRKHAVELQGLVRNWGVHAAGVVISDKPLNEMVPLRVDENKDLVLQWEKSRTEEFGLVKMDLLGLDTLDVIDETINLIKKHKNIDIDIDKIPTDDFKTFEMIGQGKTMGVFQLESSLAPLCIKIKPKSIDEISDINALGRPSCSAEQRQNYIERKLKIQNISYLHPKLENALKKTYGISLYEEAMMTVAKDCAGWDLNQADALRKITKLKGKDPELIEKTKNNFINDSVKYSGMSSKEAAQIWEHEIEPYGSYGFNKSLCFFEEVSVIAPGTSNWIDTPIEKIKSGDIVRSRDEKTGKDILIPVIGNHYHGKLPVFEIELETGEKVSCSINHKFRTSDGKMEPLWKIIHDKLEIVVSAKKQVKMSKIKNITYLGELDTYDLEVEHSDHQYYLSNGILTSNSHSVAYSYISYQTAWLKCHFPTEYMCALLNSEDPNSDKLLEYIQECSRMSIKITPPNLNTSKYNYMVTGSNSIATGLSAIKNVGDKALEEILKLQPFKSLEDFFIRTNARIINKGVIQAMAKAGVFETFNRTRKDIFENYEKYRNLIRAEIKKEKNIDLIKLPTYQEEWNRKDFLLNEREVYGRTISGSLHEIFNGFFRINQSVTLLNKIKDIPVGDKVKIEVIINAKIKEFTVKKPGKNYGRKFAKYLIEDSMGTTSELTVWMDDYIKYNHILQDGLPMKAICKVDEYMDQRSLSLSSLEGVLGKEI